MILAFDFGITNTDLVVKDDQIHYHTFPSLFSIQNKDKQLNEEAVLGFIKKINLDVKKIHSIGVTGGKSAELPDSIMDIPVIKINEIEAIGKGAKYIHNIKDESALIVSAGTGTSCVYLHGNESSHLGGIAVGGGMLEGLSSLLFKNIDGIEINEFALKGNRKYLDIMLGDAVNEIGELSPEITAANFAKAKNTSEDTIENVSAALCNMVGEVIGTVTYLNALMVGLDKAYFIGRTHMLSEVKKGIDERLKLAGISGEYNKDGAYANALGVLSILEN